MKLQLLVVCCILQSIHGFLTNPPKLNTIEKLTLTRYGYDNDDTSNYKALTPQDIDHLKINYIADGKTAPDDLAPFQCSLQYFEEPLCGCAIIKSNYVLTASHCVVGRSPNNIRIMVGSTALRSGGTYYDVERLIPHELYNTPDGAYDIALVKVKGPIQFNEKVRPIKLDHEDVPVGAEIQLTGWGNVEAGYIPNKLQYVRLVVIDRNMCKKAPFGDSVQYHHFCTINLSGGACKGDSGGPAVYKNKLVGIVNFGLPCGLGNPDVYAKVSYFIDWITEHSSM